MSVRRGLTAAALLLAAACTTTPPPATSSAAASVEDTTWTLMRLGKAEVIVPGGTPRPTLILKSQEQLAQGLGGCNRFSGSYELAGRSLRFGTLMTTRMACPRLETETAYMSALETTRSWSLFDGMLELLDADAQPLARFEASTAAP